MLDTFMKLRPCEPEDLNLLYTIENDPQMWDTSNAEGLYSRYALKQYIASAASIYECGEMRLVIEESESGKSVAVGIIDITNFSALHARAEVGIALLKEYRGRGLATQALQKLEQYAVERLHIHLLYAHVVSDNIASSKLFQKNGYKIVSKLPNWHFDKAKYVDVNIFAKFF